MSEKEILVTRSTPSGLHDAWVQQGGDLSDSLYLDKLREKGVVSVQVPLFNRVIDPERGRLFLQGEPMDYPSNDYVIDSWMIKHGLESVVLGSDWIMGFDPHTDQLIS